MMSGGGHQTTEPDLVQRPVREWWPTPKLGSLPIRGYPAGHYMIPSTMYDTALLALPRYSTPH